MTYKNTTKKTRKARKNFPLIKFICTIFFFVGTILFVINAVTDYKTYTNSEIVKANVINVSGTKNDMLNVNIDITMTAINTRRVLSNPSVKLKRVTKRKSGYEEMLRNK